MYIKIQITSKNRGCLMKTFALDLSCAQANCLMSSSIACTLMAKYQGKLRFNLIVVHAFTFTFISR